MAGFMQGHQRRIYRRHVLIKGALEIDADGYFQNRELKMN